MIDGLRIATRVATVAAIIAVAVGVYALFSSVEIPAANVSMVTQAIGAGKALINHWAPEIAWMITVVISLYFIRWSIFFLRYAVMGFKWIMVIWR